MHGKSNPTTLISQISKIIICILQLYPSGECFTISTQTSFGCKPLRGEPWGDTVGLEWREEMVETVSSHVLFVLHSSDEFTGGFLTTWGELESEEKKK